MTDKLVLILIIVACAPVLFWIAKSATYFVLVHFFGYNLTYKVNENGKVVYKKVRLSNKTSYEELVAIRREMVK